MTRELSELRTLWYMGAKTRLCEDFLDGAVRDLLTPGKTLLDGCAGTAAVSRWFAPTYRILSNDVQQFSSVVASAHLEGDESWRTQLDHLDHEQDLASAIEENTQWLTRLTPRALALEDSLLDRVIEEGSGKAGDRGALDRYRSFVAQAPLPNGDRGFAAGEEGADVHQPLASRLEALLDERRKSQVGSPSMLCTAYWSHVYFGLRQSIQIDSIRHAIEAIPHADPHRTRKRAIYLAALLHAVSVSTSGTSHFAQPRSIERDPELIAVVKRRKIDIAQQFELALEAILREWSHKPRLAGNRVFCSDVQELLDPGSPLDDEEVDLVYLDPPYTADNYSRFYHVLETLVAYDYPELESRGGSLTKGRYPKQEIRFRSDFCSSVRVEGAFRRVAHACKERNSRLLISYSTDTGLLTNRWAKQGEQQPERRFRELLLEYYGHVEIREKLLMHSGQGDSNRSVRELLLLCEE
ncbi:MAG: DNA adenine methylase [Planctomycetota bacterium]|nr:DNA adenine methylase [Planctomycetota bacterium]